MYLKIDIYNKGLIKVLFILSPLRPSSLQPNSLKSNSEALLK